jgi:putative tryptophan/tyrosine transport system substrate-binding protein
MADPLGDSLVDSMASPSGNVTGFSTLELSIAGKWLQLLKEIAPNVERATFMFNPATAPYKGGSDFLQVTEAAALSVGVKVSAAPVHEVTDIERVIAAVANEGNGGLISAPDIFVIVHRDVTIELTARYLSISIFRDRWRTDYARGPCPARS